MRKIKLKSMKNLRDLGGVTLSDGSILPYNKYLRGKALYKLNPKTIKILKDEFHLKTVIDLRTKQEAEEKPDVVIEGVKYYHIPIFNEAAVGITRERKSQTLGTLKDMPQMTSLYKTMASEECLENVNKVTSLILNLKDDELPVLFHCTAGKDRTGVIAALLLKHFGASEKDIYEDYLSTNSKFNTFTSYLKAAAISLLGLSVSLGKKVRGFLIADKKFLDAFLNSLKEKHEKTN